LLFNFLSNRYLFIFIYFSKKRSELSGHPNTCAEIVDTLGHHGLSCYRSAGRRTRHEMINDLVKRALTSAEIPSFREPNGYYREDFLWDVTCTDTLAQSYIRLSSKKAGEATRLGENVNKSRYVLNYDD
jgi:uncharacterized membrane-anchored protein YhcB (DUF1043 family)